MSKNINITNCYNSYIKIPFQSGIIYLYVYIYNADTQQNYLIDTRNITKDDTYKILLFNGKYWNKIKLDGEIDCSIYKFISVNFDFKIQQNYQIHYEFYNDQNNKIYENDYEQYFGEKPQSVDLFQNISIPQLIYTDQPLLSWQHSTDFDEDDIEYELQLYVLDHYALVENQNNSQQSTIFFQNSSTTPIYVDLNIPQNNIDRQTYCITKQLQQDNGFTISDQLVYKWRTRAKDSYGQYSQWSDFSYFKKINLLFNKASICKRIIQQNVLYQNIYIIHNVPDICFQATVKNKLYSTLNQEAYVYYDDNDQYLYFIAHIARQKRSVTTLFNSIHIIPPIDDLNMKIMISKKGNKELFQSVNILQPSDLILYFTCSVAIMLYQQATVRGYTDIYNSIDVFCFTDPLYNTLDIWDRFANEDDDLNNTIFVRYPYIEPLVINFYDSNDNRIITDNRINVYDQNGNVIYPYDSNGVNINVYPYVEDYPNQAITIYDKDGIPITVYNQYGQILTVYSDSNMIPNWQPIGTYIARYTSYANVNYLYNISTDSTTPIYSTSYNTLNVYANTTGQWKVTVNAYSGSTALFQFPRTQVLYVNISPNAVQPPFYIDGLLMTNSNSIVNAQPTFLFYPVPNTIDSDIIKYNIQISKNSDFTDLVIDDYVEQSSEMISYTIPQQKILTVEGIYYFRIGNCDYDIRNKIKSVVYSEMRQFLYNYLSTELTQKILIGYSDWKPIGFTADLRGYKDINNYIQISKWFSQDINNQIVLYKEYFQVDTNPFQITVRSVSDVNNEVLITQNHLTITNKIMLQYYYHHFPITQTYIEDGEIKERILLDVPPSHYLYNKCKIYLLNTANLPQSQQGQYTITGYARVQSWKYSDTNIGSILIMNRMNLQDRQCLKMQCRIWNMDNLPYSCDFYHAVTISNWIPDNIRQYLRNTLTIYYPSPPNVIITSNIEQRVWQTNRYATFYFSLSGQSVYPILYYRYIIDRHPNTIPTVTNGQNSTNGVVARFDLADLDSKMSGIVYVHARSVNIKGVYSEQTTHYCVYYNNKIDTPIPISVNGQYVGGNQCPVVSYTYNVILTWSRVFDAIDIGDIVTYDLQIADNVNFTNIAFSANNIYGQTYVIPPKTLAPNKYYWKVRAFDGNEYSDWSILAMLYINKAPEAPTRLSVVNYVR